MENFKVLYVDDEIINVQLFKMMFRNTFEVATAGSGAEGLQILQNDSRINVVISDWKMPEMDGVEFILKVKEMKPDMCCFMLSSYLVFQELQPMIDEGIIKYYFQKPFDKVLIPAKIKEFLGQ